MLQPTGKSKQWILWVVFLFFFLFWIVPLSQLFEPPRLLEPSFHGHGTDISPPPVQVSCRLLDGITLCICGTGVTVMQQDLTQVEDGGHTRAVFLNVSLKLLWGMRHALIQYLDADERNCNRIR